MSASRQVIAAPFDAVAARYDETFTWSKIGQAQRAAVWLELAKSFHSGQRILEIGCGTGIDACFLAKRGVRVVACDPSAHMIDVVSRRIQQHALQGLVQTHILGAENLASLRPSEAFDGAFSNFGALNCVSDPRKLATDLARLLKPGATAWLCWMGPYCIWEMMWYLAHRNRRKAFRRFKPGGVIAEIAENASVRVHYPSFKSIQRIFAPEFTVRSVRGIGVAVPPSYCESWAGRHSHLLKLFSKLDSRLGRCPGVRLLGDHVLVSLQRNRTVSPTEP
jgi:ubiquinone/menaquinone biosynthesis C-methylase UbiE